MSTVKSLAEVLEVGMGGSPAEVADLTAAYTQQRAADLAAEKALADQLNETTDTEVELSAVEKLQIQLDNLQAAYNEIKFKLERTEKALEAEKRRPAVYNDVHAERDALRQQLQQLQAQRAPVRPAIPQKEFCVIKNIQPEILMRQVNAGWTIHYMQFTEASDTYLNVVFVREAQSQPTAPPPFTTRAAPGNGKPLMDIPAAPPPPTDFSPLSMVGEGAGVGSAPPRPEGEGLGVRASFKDALAQFAAGKLTITEVLQVGTTEAFDAGKTAFEAKVSVSTFRPFRPSLPESK